MGNPFIEYKSVRVWFIKEITDHIITFDEYDMEEVCFYITFIGVALDKTVVVKYWTVAKEEPDFFSTTQSIVEDWVWEEDYQILFSRAYCDYALRTFIRVNRRILNPHTAPQ